MFFIWGIRWKTVPLGQLAYNCSHCGRSTVHTAVVENGKFTLFFIPLIPIGKKYTIVCNSCGLRLKAVAKLQEQLKELERTGQLPTSGPTESRPLPSAEAKVCRACRNPLTASKKFCSACGTPVG